MVQVAPQQIARKLVELRKVSEAELDRVKRVLKEAQAYVATIVETVREPLVVLDADLRVVSANRSFYRVFQISPEETEGRLIYELGNLQWDNPRLRVLLEERIPSETHIEDFELDHVFPAVGRRTMMLNARRIDPGDPSRPLVLIALEDITDRKQAEGVRQQLAELKTAKDRLHEEVTRLQVEEETYLRSRESGERKMKEMEADLEAAKEALQKENSKRQEAEEELRDLIELVESVIPTIQENLVAVGQESKHLMGLGQGGDVGSSGSADDRERDSEPVAHVP